MGRRVRRDETAFGEMSAHYCLIITSKWIDLAEPEKNIQWARDFWEAMQPFESEAVYINYLGAEEEDRIKAAYVPVMATWCIRS